MTLLKSQPPMPRGRVYTRRNGAKTAIPGLFPMKRYGGVPGADHSLFDAQDWIRRLDAFD